MEKLKVNMGRESSIEVLGEEEGRESQGNLAL